MKAFLGWTYKNLGESIMERGEQLEQGNLATSRRILAEPEKFGPQAAR